MPGIDILFLGALAVLVWVLGSLVFQGVRRSRTRQAQRGDLGLVRVATPDPALTARIRSALSSGAVDSHYVLGALERVTTDQPGTWYVAKMKPSSTVSDDNHEPTRVLLVIDGLPHAGTSSEPAMIEGTNRLWTSRSGSGLLLVEGAANAGEAVRDLARMKDAGARAVAAASAR